MDQFWLDVESAYKRVSADHGFEMSVRRDNKEAKVKAVAFTEGEPVAVVIIITEKNTESKQAFIVPGGE